MSASTSTSTPAAAIHNAATLDLVAKPASSLATAVATPVVASSLISKKRPAEVELQAPASKKILRAIIKNLRKALERERRNYKELEEEFEEEEATNKQLMKQLDAERAAIKKLKEDADATADLEHELAADRAANKKLQDENGDLLHELQDARRHAAAATAIASDHGSSDAGIPDNDMPADEEGDVDDAEAAAQRERLELEASNEDEWDELMEKLVPIATAEREPDKFEKIHNISDIAKLWRDDKTIAGGFSADVQSLKAVTGSSLVLVRQLSRHKEGENATAFQAITTRLAMHAMMGDDGAAKDPAGKQRLQQVQRLLLLHIDRANKGLDPETGEVAGVKKGVWTNQWKLMKTEATAMMALVQAFGHGVIPLLAAHFARVKVLIKGWPAEKPFGGSLLKFLVSKNRKTGETIPELITRITRNADVAAKANNAVLCRYLNAMTRSLYDDEQQPFYDICAEHALAVFHGRQSGMSVSTLIAIQEKERDLYAGDDNLKSLYDEINVEIRAIKRDAEPVTENLDEEGLGENDREALEQDQVTQEEQEQETLTQNVRRASEIFFGSELPEPLRYISLFSGIGVAELAIRRVFPTAECLGYAETDADALLVYRKHFPNHHNLGNVENIDGAPFRGRVDLIIGGSPCQGFSKIGKQRGFRDSRSRLFYDFMRLVRETEARYFIFENVRSMLPAIKETISAELGVTPVTLDSSLFTPQVRHRLYWCNFPVTVPAKRVSPPLSDILIADHCMKDLTSNVFRGTAASTVVKNRPPEASPVFAFTTVGHYSAGMGSRKDDKANTVTTILNDLQVIFDGQMVRRLDCVEAERLQGSGNNTAAKCVQSCCGIESCVIDNTIVEASPEADTSKYGQYQC
ncbi:hypothetical protein HKX48_001420 [Thoreauomyces humboldtii]|nr:hypothetical protein HKX48_001420 [Thoreauomyces humboldtii]